MQDESNHVPISTDRKVELLAAVVLHVLVSATPNALTLAQIAIECERDPNEPAEREEVEAALNVLVADGLADQKNKRLSATRPAMRAADLSF